MTSKNSFRELKNNDNLGHENRLRRSIHVSMDVWRIIRVRKLRCIKRLLLGKVILCLAILICVYYYRICTALCSVADNYILFLNNYMYIIS